MAGDTAASGPPGLLQEHPTSGWPLRQLGDPARAPASSLRPLGGPKC